LILKQNTTVYNPSYVNLTWIFIHTIFLFFMILILSFRLNFAFWLERWLVVWGRNPTY